MGRVRRTAPGSVAATVVLAALAGCGGGRPVAAPSSGGHRRGPAVSAPRSTTTTQGSAASSTTASSPSGSSPGTSPGTSSGEEGPTTTTAGPVSTGCASNSTSYGTLTVCPKEAAVGTTVTVTGSTDCAAGSVTGVTLVFLGPQAYVGSGGGGVDIPVTAAGAGFTATFAVPSTYASGTDAGGQPTPVTPGSGYSFATYPAGGCVVPFVVVGG